jgi:hypothetical protein
VDLLDVLVLLLAVVGVILAVAALVIAMRGSASDPFGAVKRANLERRVAHLSQRIEAVEARDGLRPKTSGSQGAGSQAPAGVEESPVTIEGALSRVGLVRFDAFADAGGAQSFSLALLDPAADGVLLTSLHSRQVTRLYIKSIRAGRADVPLSGEEVAALQEAGVRS